MRFKKIITLLFLSGFIFSCNLVNDSPDSIFKLIGLNANKVPSSFGLIFKEFRLQKAKGRLQVPAADNKSRRPATCVEAVNYFYSNTFTEDIKKIKKLNKTEETKPIIEAGIELFEYAQEIHRNDFPKIAKMIDEGKSDEEIDLAAKQLDDTKGIELDKKHEKTMKLLLPYADKHGIKYKKF
ncbi:hypothetical protein [Flavobacterium piscis]|uniref:Lipoprotein n=1 Tax=Flavobacterium piscis TaxID=1114874 RepID=A0ABU1YG84_9FLAO|nr:hypothetical protein [Flavobacterium piscis]MDR7212416.1 hypothetical protein [Flavobacterium piscis]